MPQALCSPLLAATVQYQPYRVDMYLSSTRLFSAPGPRPATDLSTAPKYTADDTPNARVSQSLAFLKGKQAKHRDGQNDISCVSVKNMHYHKYRELYNSPHGEAEHMRPVPTSFLFQDRQGRWQALAGASRSKLIAESVVRVILCVHAGARRCEHSLVRLTGVNEACRANMHMFCC